MWITRPSPAMVVSCIALFVSLGVGAHAANTIFSTDIVDGEVKTADLANLAVSFTKLRNNAVGSVKVVNESLTLVDLAGADVSGLVSLSGVANGRCSQVSLGVSGAKVGDVAVVATNGALQNGVFLYAMRVSSDSNVQASICNFSGAAMTTITDLPVRVITFR